MPADPSDPRSWLLRAHSNLLLAQKGQRKGVLLEEYKEALALAARVLFWAESIIKGR